MVARCPSEILVSIEVLSGQRRSAPNANPALPDTAITNADYIYSRARKGRTHSRALCRAPPIRSLRSSGLHHLGDFLFLCRTQVIEPMRQHFSLDPALLEFLKVGTSS